MFIGGVVFIGLFFMFVIWGGFIWKFGYCFMYKDEFLNMIDIIVYKYVVFGLFFSMGVIFLLFDEFVLNVFYSMMVIFYFVLMCLIYGVLIIW